MKALSVSKVTRNGPGGRITIAMETLAVMGLGIGDFVQFIEEEDGKIFIQKVGPVSA